MMYALIALAVGFLLDLLLGDPLWLPHPVVAMGKLISLLERILRRVFPKTPRGEFAAGVILAVILPLVSGGIAAACLWLLGLIHPFLSLAAECWMCYQILATKGLAQAGRAVYQPLAAGDLEKARQAVGRVVGRDTQNLSAEGIARAAVETLAENSSDGVIAPMLFIALGGAPFGMLYKAINTMDSMVGYKNERYFYFGRAAARLDDAANYLPSRLCAILSLLAAKFAGFDPKGGWRVFRRDRNNHTSPNSAQTEAIYAGALGVRLGGDASYFGKIVRKPGIGSEGRPAGPEDIPRAVRLLYWTASLGLFLCLAARGAAVLIVLGTV